MFGAEIKDWVSKLPKNRNRNLPSPGHPDPRNELVGIAMSGGGMRSATYNLGVAQALARGGLLKEVDYMSTVSGGGYFGSSLTSLTSENLPYNDDWDARLDMTREGFPYAFPSPLPEDSEEPSSSPEPVPVHGMESPATRHVREHGKLLAPAFGLFQTEVWTALSRYLVSTALLFALYLLPTVTAIFLLTILIPEEFWARSDPFGIIGDGANSWLGMNRWFWTIPAWFFGPVGLLAVIFRSDPKSGDHFSPDWVRRIQRFFLMLAAATGGAVLFAAALWGFTFAIDAVDFSRLSEFGELKKIVLSILGALGVGGAAATGVSARKMMVPKSAERLLWKLLFAVGGYIILGIGLVLWYYILVSWLAEAQLEVLPTEGLGIYWGGFALAWNGVILAYLITWIWGHDLLNRLSIHRLYERRIGRTWVIGGKPPYPPGSDGVPNPRKGWSRVWVRPDIKMSDLKKGLVTSPYHLICTALNIPGSTGPKLLDRKADSFVIGPVYSGSALTRWAPTESLPAIAGMSLARATTISAAAVSPNMGRVTSTTLSVLTTLFNLRLGWWVPNPRRATGLRRYAARLPGFLYWKEMFGHASHEDAFVYLSDGGHFENLGIYELLRRRCKYIIAVDGTGEPPDSKDMLNFGGLAIPLRLARIDFGVEVHIDLRPIMRNSETGLVKSHFAVGRIRYPRGIGRGSGEHSEEDSGILVLVKAGRVEGEMQPDIINYLRQVNEDFPHDTTADQQFDQAQFESYRQLGFTAGSILAGVAGSDDVEVARRFENLDRWYQRLPRDLDQA
ncbi:MAG: patatin-like phospholipase family protein [Chloroflexi bacterium]|nr:patatin-like phospholipase family protein [Chloroflexota bacterium]